MRVNVDKVLERDSKISELDGRAGKSKVSELDGVSELVNSGLTSHQQRGHTETGPRLKSYPKDRRSGGYR